MDTVLNSPKRGGSRPSEPAAKRFDITRLRSVTLTRFYDFLRDWRQALLNDSGNKSRTSYYGHRRIEVEPIGGNAFRRSNGCSRSGAVPRIHET